MHGPFRFRSRSLVAAAVAAFVTASAALPMAIAGAQRAAPEATRPTVGRGWVVRTDPFADLWFHGMAMLRLDGFHALPLYDAAYRSRVTGGLAAPARPTRLDRVARTLGATFRADSAFEVLHFVPLYVAGNDPGVVLALLHAVALGTPAPRADPALGQAITAIVAALPGNARREALASFADALADEWRSGFGATYAAAARNRADTVRLLNDAWTRTFEPSVAPYLAAIGMPSGTVLVSPAIGGEGRMSVEAPSGPIVAVGLHAAGNATDAPLHATVREMAFPLVRRAMAGSGTFVDRVYAERISDAAAVRAGAMILAASSNNLGAEFKAQYLALHDPAGFSPARDGGAFARAYPMSSALESALKTELTRLMQNAPGR